jgi:hypothetical protein
MVRYTGRMRVPAAVDEYVLSGPSLTPDLQVYLFLDLRRKGAEEAGLRLVFRFGLNPCEVRVCGMPDTRRWRPLKVLLHLALPAKRCKLGKPHW